jgi:putative oxygen-independent coproporphyrinogen III oxidase
VSTGRVRHLYVHLPFCADRCGYCDFVTVLDGRGSHHVYVDALLRELEQERPALADQVETIFLGGGTPTLTEPAPLARLLDSLPAAEEVTVEANPETVTPQLAHLLRTGGVTRVSVGAQSFSRRLLRVLERRAGPDDVRRAVHTLRDANFDNISLDLIYGIPGQSAAELEHDFAEALGLAPEHLSLYELEAKPGTRFTHAWADELVRQAEAMETYLERVVQVLTSAGYRWYETASFCRSPAAAGQRDLRARHNLAYWHGRDYLGLGIGAVSTVGGRRWRNRPSLPRYLASLAAGEPPPREIELLDPRTRRWERAMLGLRLDEPLPLEHLRGLLEHGALERLGLIGLCESDAETRAGGPAIRLTDRGRLLGDAVTAELLVAP